MTAQKTVAMPQNGGTRVFVGCIGGLLLSLAVLALSIIAFGPHPVDVTDALSVRKGMTHEDVKEMLGDPHVIRANEWHYKCDYLDIKDRFIVAFDHVGHVERASW